MGAVLGVVAAVSAIVADFAYCAGTTGIVISTATVAGIGVVTGTLAGVEDHKGKEWRKQHGHRSRDNGYEQPDMVARFSARLPENMQALDGQQLVWTEETDSVDGTPATARWEGYKETMALTGMVSKQGVLKGLFSGALPGHNGTVAGTWVLLPRDAADSRKRELDDMGRVISTYIELAPSEIISNITATTLEHLEGSDTTTSARYLGSLPEILLHEFFTSHIGSNETVNALKTVSRMAKGNMLTADTFHVASLRAALSMPDTELSAKVINTIFDSMFGPLDY